MFHNDPYPPPTPKETTLERADFTIQRFMCVTEEKEKTMFIIFFLTHFFSCCPRGFKLGQAKCKETTLERAAF